MELKRVVVTGLGAITPLGNDVETTWKNALAGVSGAGPITHFDTTLFKTKFACEVKGFKAEDYVPAGDRHALRDFKKFDLYTQYAMAAAKQAVEDAGLLSDDKLDRDQVGVIFGSGIGGIHTFEQEVSYYAKNEANGPKYSPFLIPAMIADMAAGRISIEYGFRGPNYGVVSACATSTNAMIDAFTYVRTGKAPVIVTGGSEAPICPVGVGGFNSMKALSTRNDSPETASRPFSASRDGFVIGEGGVCLIFEELEHALARGAKIYGEVIGGGMSADAYHITASHPEGLGAKLVMERAIEDAGITPDDVDYINVHGTSTHVGDLSEAKAIKDLFGDHAYALNISSTKSMTGHMLGAAGGVECIAAALALKNGVVPPTINLREPDPECDLNYVPNQAVQADIRVALSSSLGFGGHNGVLALRKV